MKTIDLRETFTGHSGSFLITLLMLVLEKIVKYKGSDSTDLDGKGHKREDQHSALTSSRYRTHIWHINTL